MYQPEEVMSLRIPVVKCGETLRNKCFAALERRRLDDPELTFARWARQKLSAGADDDLRGKEPRKRDV